MFLFNPDANRLNLAQVLREEEQANSHAMRLGDAGYTKKSNREDRVETIGGIPYQRAGGGRRRLSTVRSGSY